MSNITEKNLKELQNYLTQTILNPIYDIKKNDLDIALVDCLELIDEYKNLIDELSNINNKEYDV